MIIEEWYVNSDVTIEVEIPEREKQRDRELIDLKELDDNGKLVWHELELKEEALMQVYWSYDKKLKTILLKGKNDERATEYIPNLVCNGIIIPTNYDKKISHELIKDWPTLYVVDKKGKLDLGSMSIS